MISSVCVIGGLGNMGSKHVKKLDDIMPQIRVFNEGVAEFKSFPFVHVKDVDVDPDYPLDTYDALIIATPSTTHYELAKTAIENGQHVLVEKPVTLSYRQAQTLYRLAKEYNVVYMSGHTMRYNPEFRKALPTLYHSEKLDFKMLVPHKNKIENATFDLMIHGFELAFNLGQREFTRDFELIDCGKGKNIIFAQVNIGSKECQFAAGYHMEEDLRHLTGTGILGTIEAEVDFHASDGKQPDALSNLHEHFIRACDQGTWIDQAEYATAAVQLAEQVQHCLFPGVDPVV